MQIPPCLWPDVTVISIPDGKDMKERLGLEIQGDITSFSGDKQVYKLKVYISEKGHFRVINSGESINFPDFENPYLIFSHTRLH